MPNTREITELQNLSGVAERFNKLTVAQALERKITMAELINKWDVVNKLIDIENWCQQHKLFDGFMHKRLYEKICELERAIGKTPGEEMAWIPVAERLPEEGETVLVFGYWHEKFQPLMCYLSPHRKGEWFTSVAGQQVYTVTHWMPLPQPPKGD